MKHGSKRQTSKNSGDTPGDHSGDCSQFLSENRSLVDFQNGKRVMARVIPLRSEFYLHKPLMWPGCEETFFGSDLNENDNLTKDTSHAILNFAWGQMTILSTIFIILENL